MWEEVIPFTEDPFDQWRASEAGAFIVFDDHGQPKWKFTSPKKYGKYLELNSKRQEWEERRKAKTGNADQEEVRS